MAEKDQPFSRSVPFLLLLLLCSCSLFFLFSSLRSSDAFDNTLDLSVEREIKKRSNRFCNYSDGVWIKDGRTRTRYDGTCKEIFKGWNCMLSGKPNARDLVKWRWQPRDCDLPPLDPLWFLERFRDTNIGFVGDSLNRNMFISLVCTLKQVSNEFKKWRPAGADRGFTFLKYNLTVAYHRTNLLARYGSWSPSIDGGVLESLGYKRGYRVDVDVPEHTWAEAPSFHHILIVNTGHWWRAPSKFDPIHSPMIFFEGGSPVLPPISPEFGLDMTLKYTTLFIEKKMGADAPKFFRTQSPRHFEGGDWNEGGSCQRLQPFSSEQVENLYSLKRNGTNLEARQLNQHVYKALKSSTFRILDVTRMSEFRADAHPSTAGGKKHEDCMHWCLPGITDTWNDLLVAYLKGQSWEKEEVFQDFENKKHRMIINCGHRFETGFEPNVFSLAPYP